MKNFEFEHEGQKLWYSRSLACNLTIFTVLRVPVLDLRQTYVLAHKRGSGCEYNAGRWNIQGGFIDFDETAEECAVRETWEEVGIDVSNYELIFCGLDTEPHGKRQTMVASFALFVPWETAISWQPTNEHSENDEVEEIEWVNIDKLDNKIWCHGQVANIKRNLKIMFND